MESRVDTHLSASWRCWKLSGFQPSLTSRARMRPLQALLAPSDRKAEDQARREAALRHIQDDYEARKLVQERQRLALQAAEDAAAAKAAAEAAERAAAQQEEHEEA